jgi:hypothetical protein
LRFLGDSMKTPRTSRFKQGYSAALKEQDKRGKRVLARVPHFRILPPEVIARIKADAVDRSAQRVVEGSTGLRSDYNDYA